MVTSGGQSLAMPVRASGTNRYRVEPEVLDCGLTPIGAETALSFTIQSRDGSPVDPVRWDGPATILRHLTWRPIGLDAVRFEAILSPAGVGPVRGSIRVFMRDASTVDLLFSLWSAGPGSIALSINGSPQGCPFI